MTPAALLVSLAGLSHREASDFLGVRLDTVQSWHRKTRPNNSSPGVIAELSALIRQQEEAAGQGLALIADRIRQGTIESIELGYPADEREAQALGLPCVGAWAAMAARVVAQSPVPVRLVPRGSTTATVAAIQAHIK